MERVPGGDDGEVSIHRLLGEKRYLAYNAGQIRIAGDPYSWTIEQAQNKAFFLYVRPINFHIIPRQHDLEIQNT